MPVQGHLIVVGRTPNLTRIFTSLALKKECRNLVFSNVLLLLEKHVYFVYHMFEMCSVLCFFTQNLVCKGIKERRFRKGAIDFGTMVKTFRRGKLNNSGHELDSCQVETKCEHLIELSSSRPPRAEPTGTRLQVSSP